MEANVALLEAEELNTRLQLALISNEKLTTQLGSAQEEIKSKSNLIIQLRQQLSELEQKVDDLKNENKSVRLKHQTLFASEAKESQIQKLVTEHEMLETENKKLKKYIISSKSRHEAVTSDLSQKLQETQLKVKRLTEESTVAHADIEENEFMIKHLRQQVKSAQGQVITWRELAESTRNDELVSDDLKKMAVSLHSVANEHEKLTKIMTQIQQGKEPEMSAILNSSDGGGAEEPCMSNVEAIDTLRKSEEQLGQNCAILREMIFENYADLLCNKSGCISQ